MAKASSFEKKDKALDKKQGVKENSKKDMKLDSSALTNIKAAMMGRKRGKR